MALVPEHPFITKAKIQSEASGKAKVKVAGIQAASREKIAGIRERTAERKAEARRKAADKAAEVRTAARGKVAEERTKTAGVKAEAQETVAGIRAGVQQERLEFSQEQVIRRKAEKREKFVTKEAKEAGELGKKIVISSVETLIQMPSKIRPLKFADIVHPDDTVKNTEPYFGDGRVPMPNTGKPYSGDWRDLHQPGRVQTREDAASVLAAYDKLGEEATMANIIKETELDSYRIKRAIRFLEKNGLEIREV